MANVQKFTNWLDNFEINLFRIQIKSENSENRIRPFSYIPTVIHYVEICWSGFQMNADWLSARPISKPSSRINLKPRLGSESVLVGDYKLLQHYFDVVFEIFCQVLKNVFYPRTDFWNDSVYFAFSFVRSACNYFVTFYFYNLSL